MLDIRLQIGWIGFLLLLAGYYLLLSTALGRARSRTEYIAVVAIMVLVFSMDLTESTLFFGAMWLIAWVFLAPYGPSTHRSRQCGQRRVVDPWGSCRQERRVQVRSGAKRRSLRCTSRSM